MELMSKDNKQPTDIVLNAMEKLSEENRDKLLRLFINRSLAFEIVLKQYTEIGKQAPEDVLSRMGYAGLSSIEVYKEIRDYEAEKILYGVKTDE